MPDSFHVERMAYRVREAADILAISRSRFYELVAEGRIRILKDGARTLVRRRDLSATLMTWRRYAPPGGNVSTDRQSSAFIVAIVVDRRRDPVLTDGAPAAHCFRRCSSQAP